MHRQGGNVLFLILIAVALFSALSIAVTGSSRTSGATKDREQATLDQADIDNYASAMDFGEHRLVYVNKCTSIDFTPPADQVDGDKSCHMFHPDGGDVGYRVAGLGTGCPLADLSLGQECNGVIFTGTTSGNRLYTTVSDLTGKYSWNNGSTDSYFATGVSGNDGVAITDVLVELTGNDAPYDAAVACRALGPEWGLPSVVELRVMLANRDEGALSGTYTTTGGAFEQRYRASNELSASAAKVISFPDGGEPGNTKNLEFPVRCVRRD